MPSPAQILRLAAFAMPPFAVVAPRGLAILLPLAAVAVAITGWKSTGLPRLPRIPAAIIAAFLAWSAASALWAADPHLVWPSWGQIAALALAGLVLLGSVRDADGKSREQIGLALSVGMVVALSLLALEWVSGQLLPQSFGAMIYTRRSFNTFIFNRGAATLALLVWPAAFAVRRRYGWPPALLLIATTLAVVAQFESMAAILGLAGGATVSCLAAWRTRPTALALAAGLALATACLPALARLPVVADLASRADTAISISHRLQIWSFVGGAIAERRFAGWGLNASRELPGGIDEFAPGARRLPLHPHNAILQWWLELGAVGAALGTALGLAAIHGATLLTRDARGFGLALFASAFLVASVGYGIWQAWWMAALWLAAGLMAAIGAPAKAETSSPVLQ